MALPTNIIWYIIIGAVSLAFLLWWTRSNKEARDEAYRMKVKRRQEFSSYIREFPTTTIILWIVVSAVLVSMLWNIGAYFFSYESLPIAKNVIQYIVLGLTVVAVGNIALGKVTINNATQIFTMLFTFAVLFGILYITHNYVPDTFSIQAFSFFSP